MYQVMPILATIDLASAAAASESAYTVVPELFSQRDRILGSAIVGITQVSQSTAIDEKVRTI